MRARAAERYPGLLALAGPTLRTRAGACVLALVVLALLLASAVAPAAARAALNITSGPSGVTPSDDAVFTFALTDDEEPDDDDDDDDGDGDDDEGDDDDDRSLAPKKVKFECRLDDGKWKKCSSPVSYKDLDAGEHRFEVRRHKRPSTWAERVWTIRRPVPPPPPRPEPPPPPRPQPPPPPRPEPPPPPRPQPPPRPEPPAPPAPPRPDPAPSDPSPVVVDPPAGGTGTPVDVPRGDVTPPSVSIEPDATLAGTMASFRFAADEPVAGFECSLGDAPFQACTSPASYRVEASGSYVLRVRATDLAGNRGSAAVSAWTVMRASSPGGDARIDAAPPPPGATGAQARAVPLSPFPLVRLAGLVYRTSVKVTVLSVRAPVGARVAIVCHGSSCPLRRSARLVAAKGRRTVQTVTFARLRNVRLRAGTVLEVRVTRAGRIGKYVRFAFVRGRAPKRSDRCLAPGSSAPTACAS